MHKLPTRFIELLEGLDPRVRRRRKAYAVVEARIEDQDVPAGSFRCEECETVQSQFAVAAVAKGDGEQTELWCLDCIEDREATTRPEGRSLGGVNRE